MYLRTIRDKISKLKSEWVSARILDSKILEQEALYAEQLEALKTNKRIRDLEKRTQKDSLAYNKHIAKLKELSFVYSEYQKKLKERFMYDFSDMINFVVLKMRSDDELTDYFAEKYQFLMIDEYQDTNNPQNEILDLILSRSDDTNIAVVWDDDQSIYKFQGANIENMLDFYTKYPETQFIVLEKNYRSSQSILDLSKNLIENNSERLINRISTLEKNLLAESQYKNLEQNLSVVCASEELEKIYVYQQIQSINNTETIAIITRSNKELEDWTSFMQLQWLQISSKLKSNILANHYVDFLLDLLEIIDNPYANDTKFLSILRSSIIDVKNIDALTLNREIYKKNYSRAWFPLKLWDVIKNIDTNFAAKHNTNNDEYDFESTLEHKYIDYKKIVAFRDLINEMNGQLGTHGIARLITQVLNETWLLEYVELHWCFSDTEDIYTLFHKVQDMLEKNKNLSIAELIEKLNLHKKYWVIIPRQILKKQESRIEILTAHGAKWLEYDHVFIVGTHGWNWNKKTMRDLIKLPLWVVWQGLQFHGLDEKEQKRVEKELQLQEERRLFFVAITRAKQSLTLTRAAGKDNKPYIDWPFVLEMWIESDIIQELDKQFILQVVKNELLETKLVATTDEELEYISDFLVNYKLSPTDLNTFLEDPLQFLQWVVFKYPFEWNEFTIFWNVYHKVLEVATCYKMQWELLSLEKIIQMFQELLNKQIITQEEKIRLEKKWIEWLTGYYEIFKNNTRRSLQVEYNFKPRNIVFEWVPITGKVDKIEKITESDSGLEKVALVDYKTGKLKTEWAIKWLDRYGNKKDSFSEWRYYRQLLFYKLLADHDTEFCDACEIAELALDFVEWKDGQYKYLAIHIDQQDYAEFKELVKHSWEQMNNMNFWREVLGK